MATFDFPASPNDNDTYSLNGVTYKYVAAKQRWEIVPTPHNFETSAQLDIRDTANRSRSNHTGTQTASTISDFDTEVSNNVDVAANTAARHGAVTTTDSSTIAFTLTGQQLSAGVVAGSIDTLQLSASVNQTIADLENTLGALSPNGGTDVAITVPLGYYDTDAALFIDRPLLGRYFPYEMIVSGVTLTLDEAASGDSFQVDIKQNGISIFSSVLTLVDGQTKGSSFAFAQSMILFKVGDVITFDVVKVGSTSPGKYPVVTIEGIKGGFQSLVVPLSPIDTDATITLDKALLGKQFPYNLQLKNVVLSLDDAPTGGDFRVDIKQKGVSIFNTLLTVADGTTLSTVYDPASVPIVLAKGNLVTYSVEAVGLTTPGQYPVVTIVGREV